MKMTGVRCTDAEFAELRKLAQEAAVAEDGEFVTAMASESIIRRYGADAMRRIWRKARDEDVEQGGRFDARSAAINLYSQPWPTDGSRDESELMGTAYFVWGNENRLDRIEVEDDEKFTEEEVLRAFAGLIERALKQGVDHAEPYRE